MPSPNKRLCVFGDSHFACTKLALDQGLVDSADVDIEFWGNIGKQFRHLTWRNEQIEPLDEFTAGRFAKTNSNARTVLTAAPFDMVFFMGCRIDVCRLFPEALYRRKTPMARLSAGVEQRWITDFLNRQPPYQFAKNFAAQNTAKIVSAPVSFDTDGLDDEFSPEVLVAREAEKTDRDSLWDTVEQIMIDDGIGLIRQPEDTIVKGCFTDQAYAVRNYRERGDRTHKNAQYGAIILNMVVEKLRQA